MKDGTVFSRLQSLFATEGRGVLGVILATLLLHLPTLTLTPGVNHDEAMLNAAARNWSQGEPVALSPMAEVGKTYGTSYYWHPPGHLVTMAGAYYLFGFSVEVTRGVSLASVALAGALFFLVLRRLSLSAFLAFGTVGLWLLLPQTTWLARSGRMDGMALLFGFAAILALPIGAKPRLGSWIAAGSLIGFGSLFHVMILIWAPTLWVAYCVRSREILWRAGFLTAAAAATPVLLWIAVTFLRGDGPAWIEQFWGYNVTQRSASGSWLGRFPDELLLLASQTRFVPLLALLPLAGLGLSLWRFRLGEDRSTQAAALTAFLIIAGLTAKGTGVYPLYWMIWVLIAMAVCFGRLPSRVVGVAILAGLTNGLAWFGFQSAVAWYQREARSPARVEAFFAQHLPRRSIVMGPEEVWYAVEKVDGELRIWADPENARHDYWVTRGNTKEPVPAGFELVAELPDVMPRVFGKYFSHTAFAYRPWRRIPSSP